MMVSKVDNIPGVERFSSPPEELFMDGLDDEKNQPELVDLKKEEEEEDAPALKTPTNYKTEQQFSTSPWSKLVFTVLMWGGILGVLVVLFLILTGIGSLIFSRSNVTDELPSENNSLPNEPAQSELDLARSEIERLKAKEATRIQEIELKQKIVPTQEKFVSSEVVVNENNNTQPKKIPTTQIPQQQVVTTSASRRSRGAAITPAQLSRIAASSGHYRADIDWSTKAVTPEANNSVSIDTPLPTIEFLDNEGLLTWGTTARGELETQIGWEGSIGAIASKNFSIRLKQHLSSPSGEVIIPRGTKILATIANAKATGEIQLIAKYFQLEPSNGKVMRVSIPNNTVLLQDRDRDGLLIAKPIPKKTLGRDAIAAILGGAAKMTEIINRPESSSYNSWNGGASQTIVNGSGNIGAAFIGGAAEQLNSRMSKQNEAEINRRMSEPIVFVLEKGSEIEIYINENFRPKGSSKEAQN